MRDRPRDKMRGRGHNKAQADDFTEIPGVPGFVTTALHQQGVLTYDQLWDADLHWLPQQVRWAIERWRGE